MQHISRATQILKAQVLNAFKKNICAKNSLLLSHVLSSMVPLCQYSGADEEYFNKYFLCQKYPLKYFSTILSKGPFNGVRTLSRACKKES